MSLTFGPGNKGSLKRAVNSQFTNQLEAEQKYSFLILMLQFVKFSMDSPKNKLE
jgi:hypothetical protein